MGIIEIIDNATGHRGGTIRRTGDHLHNMGRRLWRFQRNLLKGWGKVKFKYSSSICVKIASLPVASMWDYHNHCYSHCSISQFPAIFPPWRLWHNHHRKGNHWQPHRPKLAQPNDDSRHSTLPHPANDTDGRDSR